MAKLRFGYFIAPFHRAGTNPTLALQRDLEFVEHLDAIGFDEVWIGEHHSAGSEIISSPEVFIAAAAERAKRIRFGTGVISLRVPQPAVGGRPADAARPPHPRPGHRRRRPGLAADRLGDDRPDARPTPASCWRPTSTSSSACWRGETVTAKTATHELFDAQLQLAPYSDGGIPLAVAAVASPTGAAAGGQARHRPAVDRRHPHRRGVRRARSPLGHRRGTRRRVRHHRRPRRTGRWCGPFHIAETDEQARADVRFGIEPWFRYFQKVAAFPQMTIARRPDRRDDRHHQRGGRRRHRHARAAPSGQVQRLWDQSGGFGCMLQMGHEWANPAATRRSAELFAAEVIPHFQGQAQADAGRRGARQRRARGPGPDADERHRAHDREVRGREGRRLAEQCGA